MKLLFRFSPYKEDFFYKLTGHLSKRFTNHIQYSCNECIHSKDESYSYYSTNHKNLLTNHKKICNLKQNHYGAMIFIHSHRCQFYIDKHGLKKL